MPSFSLPYFAECLAQRKKSVFFLQIGAMDGSANDPIYRLVRAHGWQGILVEPMLEHFEKLRENYADCSGLVFENIAVTESTGLGTMYRLPSELVRSGKVPAWGAAASSFFPDRNALGWAEIRPHLLEVTVSCMSLPDLLKKHRVKELDVLQVDAEGYDYRILRQLNFKKFKPSIVNIEIVNLTKSELAHGKQLLDRAGYLHAKTGYDLLAVSDFLLR